MAQFAGALWWQASLQKQLSCQALRSKMHGLSSVTVSPYLSRTTWEDMLVPRPPSELTNIESPKLSAAYPAVVCFRDDDATFPEYLVERDLSDMSVRTNLEIRYSPWAVEMMNGFGKKDDRPVKESTGIHKILFFVVLSFPLWQRNRSFTHSI